MDAQNKEQTIAIHLNLVDLHILLAALYRYQVSYDPWIKPHVELVHYVERKIKDYENGDFY